MLAAAALPTRRVGGNPASIKARRCQSVAGSQLELLCAHVREVSRQRFLRDRDGVIRRRTLKNDRLSCRGAGLCRLRERAACRHADGDCRYRDRHHMNASYETSPPRAAASYLPTGNLSLLPGVIVATEHVRAGTSNWIEQVASGLMGPVVHL
jgi:hypothetical protein